MAKPRFWRRIRFKLLLVSLTLLGIPLAGYRFIQETEQFLRDAQDQALQTTASSVANIMHGHDDQFHGVARPGSVLTFRNLRLHELDEPPQVDGYRDDWIHFEHNFSVIETIDRKLRARIYLGQFDRHLYLLIGVTDPRVSYGERGDSVDLALTDEFGELQRYRVRPSGPGWVSAMRVRDADGEPQTRAGNVLIRGEWQQADDGYTLELKLPREAIGDRLSLRFYDVDNNQVLASGRLFPSQSLGRIIAPSQSLAGVLDDITPPATRIWVTDHQGLVLAQAGHLDANAPLSTDEQRMPWFIRDLILAVLPRDADTVAELPRDRTHLFVNPVIDALSGRPTSLRRQPPGSNAVVVSAAVPIRSSEGVEGAVLVEQTTNAILSIQNLALQRLFGVTLLFFAITSLGLLAFASVLATRIKHLRDRVEQAVGHDGRIIGRLEADVSQDEIGDLGRSFASVLDRLHEYNHYLEAMASRLAHELRTPLAVVRSSLDNAEQAQGKERDIYLERARHGTARLDDILQRLREATRLEQAMRSAEPVEFDLASLLRLQTAELNASFPDSHIVLTGADTPVQMVGVPELLSQALDKLVGNAIDFHTPGSDIVINCSTGQDKVVIGVSNAGPTLPDGLDVFQSMVSGREGHGSEPHLGLGLYLVRLIAEFHGGKATALNTESPPGVRVELLLARRLAR
jgi:dedicated sortase system histidine kinase